MDEYPQRKKGVGSRSPFWMVQYKRYIYIIIV